MTSAKESAHGKSVRVHRRVEEHPKIQVARATSVESHISSAGRSVVNKTVMAARVHKHDLEVREFEVARGSFSGDN